MHNEDDDEEQLNASRNPESASNSNTEVGPDSAANSNTEVGPKSDKGPSEEELELIAALERANKALEEEAEAAKAKKQEEELVAALERANQGTQ